MFICFLAMIFSGISARIVHLPDGRIFDVPHQESYPYLLKEDSPASLERLYILSESHPDAALLCPKEYFIFEMKQHLIVNESLNHLLPESIQKEQTISLQHLESNDDFQRGPCPTAYHCLGYQACRFRYGNDQCQRDSIPSLEEYLLLTVGCFREDLFETPKQFRKNKNLVLHVYYSLDEKTSDKGQMNLIHKELQEEAVFTGKCPNLETAKQEGYFGDCFDPPPSDEVVSQQLWPILSKFYSESCRRKVVQSYCAIQYSQQALCAPPFLENKKAKGGRRYGFQALPLHENHLTMIQYKKFLLKKSVDLIPVRLAFVIMVEDNVQQAVKLIESVYRKNFIFVIHVNKERKSVREELEEIIRKHYSFEHNIFIIPIQRSFSTLIESYETVRAKLEGFEELLHLGIWDYVITLNEEDLLLRNIDDLAATLALTRGLSFFSDIRLINNTAKELVISCENGSHKLSFHGNLNRSNLPIYSSSQDGILSREFVEYLVDEKRRDSNINNQQFYLQMMQSSYNSYIPTILMNSPFRDSLHLASFHAVKRLSIENNFSSYSSGTVKDYGSLKNNVSIVEDESIVFTNLVHRFYFAKNYKLADANRNYLSKLTQGQYNMLLEHVLPTIVLKTLVETSLQNISKTAKFARNEIYFNSILNLRISPLLMPAKETCRAKIFSAYTEHVDFNYWFDVSVDDKRSGNQEIVRLLLEPVTNTRNCYASGNLRMISLSPWDSENNEEDLAKRTNIVNGTLLPYFTSTIRGISAQILVACESDTFTVQSGCAIKLEISLVSPSQVEKCIQFVNFSDNSYKTVLDIEESKELKIAPNLYSAFIPCVEMEQGFWMLKITQIQPRSERKYMLPFYLLDLKKLNEESTQLKDISLLWKIKSFAFISENDSYNFQRDELEQQSDFSQQKHLSHKSVIPKKPFLFEEENQNFIKAERKKEKLYIFICGGGLSCSFAVVLAVISLCCGWRYRFHQKLVMGFILMLSLITIFQIMLILSVCK